MAPINKQSPKNRSSKNQSMGVEMDNALSHSTRARMSKRGAESRRVNNQSMGEEIANAISHGTGALLAIAGAAVLIVFAALHGRAIGIVSASIYSASLIFLYLASTLYHSLTPYIAKRLFQVFDHCSIFILILGSYAPFSLSLLGGAAGWVLFGWNILLTVIGVVLNSFSVKRFQAISMVLYLLMGWSVVAVIHALPPLPRAAWALMISGGLAYTLGIIFFALKKPRFMHFIWHLFVLAGSVLHYFLILLYVI
jgi:hemolysin III